MRFVVACWLIVVNEERGEIVRVVAARRNVTFAELSEQWPAAFSCASLLAAPNRKSAATTISCRTPMTGSRRRQVCATYRPRRCHHRLGVFAQDARHPARQASRPLSLPRFLFARACGLPCRGRRRHSGPPSGWPSGLSRAAPPRAGCVSSTRRSRRAARSCRSAASSRVRRPSGRFRDPYARRL